VTINHCTIVSNSAGGRGGGIYLGSGTLSLSNSIVAGNTAPGGAPEVNITVNGDYNLFLRTNGLIIAVGMTHNLRGVNPLLGPLQDNGGATPTHALLPGSPAMDKGTRGGLTWDQRGRVRRVDDPALPNASGGDGSDIGAVETAVLPVLNLARNGTDMQISFNTAVGQTCRVERAEALLSGTWTSVTTNVPGTGSPVTMMDTNAASLPRGFYRARCCLES
jgi:hypothetical protein